MKKKRLICLTIWMAESSNSLDSARTTPWLYHLMVPMAMEMAIQECTEYASDYISSQKPTELAGARLSPFITTL
jgi:hypothetical protein